MLTCGLALYAFPASASDSVEAGHTTEQLRLLQEQNHKLQAQLEKQQELIDSLSKKVSAIESTSLHNATEVRELESKVDTAGSSAAMHPVTSPGKVTISGEGGVGFFKTGSEGRWPKGDFRLDEARLFLESAVHEDVYFFTEINLAQREAIDWSVQLGETYLDFENVSKLWGQERLLNVRLGRMYIPFGEEYMERYAIDNPLISHSLSDLWGVDQGLELYGAAGPISYAVAVQNGGVSSEDFTSDKSVAGRLSYDPLKWLHFSVSGMRTGNLAIEDWWSAMWFGNGWIFPFNLTNTSPYHAEIVEGDLRVSLPHGHLKAFGGYLHEHANESSNADRDVYYYSVEGVHDITAGFYGAVRFSQIFAGDGFPIIGNAPLASYIYSPTTTEIWRLSLGLGYRFSRNLVLKGEYTIERGKELSGEVRNHEDLFAIEAAFKF
jgi:hypothetical protein